MTRLILPILTIALLASCGPANHAGSRTQPVTTLDSSAGDYTARVAPPRSTGTLGNLRVTIAAGNDVTISGPVAVHVVMTNDGFDDFVGTSGSTVVRLNLVHEMFLTIKTGNADSQSYELAPGSDG